MRRKIRWFQAGIYVIINIKNGMAYVGSSRHSMKERWKMQRHELRHGYHHNPALQRDWRTYGPEAFRFIVLEPFDDPVHLREQEAAWIERIGERRELYNIETPSRRKDDLPKPAPGTAQPSQTGDSDLEQ